MKRLEIPVLPLVINGSRGALPKNSLDFEKTKVVVQVLNAIPPGSFRELTVEDLTIQVREKVKNSLVLSD